MLTTNLNLQYNLNTYVVFLSRTMYETLGCEHDFQWLHNMPSCVCAVIY